MTLTDVLNQMIQENQAAGQPTDLRIGTVTSAAPLEITVNVAAAPLQAGQLYLTEAVVEKKLSSADSTTASTNIIPVAV